MPRLELIKGSFAGGELSPSLYSRVDLTLYPKGAKLLKNFTVHPHGGVSNRPGTYYMSTGKYDGKKSRVIPFEFSTLQNYILEFGNYYIRFYVPGVNGGQVLNYSTWATATAYAVGVYVLHSGTYYKCLLPHTSGVFADDLTANDWTATSWVTSHDYIVGNFVVDSGVMYYCATPHSSTTFSDDLLAGKWVAQTIYEVATPYSENDLAALNYTQSADVLYLAHPLYQPRELSRLGENNWSLDLYDFVGGPFQLQNTDVSQTLAASAVTGTITLTASGFTFQSTHVGSLWQLQHYIQGQSSSTSFASATTSSSIKCGGTWRIITHGTWTGKFQIEKSTDNGSNWTMLRQFSSVDDYNADTYGTEDMSDNAEPFLVRVNMYSYTSGTCNADLTSDPFYQLGIARITVVAGGGATATATVERTLGATTATIDWSEGSWSDYRGWPATVEFSPQDRLMFANTITEPQTHYDTKIGNYVDFSRGDPLADNDGITANLPSRKVNGITSIVPLSTIIALTSSSEWGILSSTGSSITPTSILHKVYGYQGSAGVHPVVIGNRAIYVQVLSTIIRDLGYDLYSDSFTGANISILSDHLFTGYSILEMAYQQNPDSIVWCVRSDGRLLSLTYMKEQDVIAWTWNETYQSGALAWATGESYVVGNWVTYEGDNYYCNTNHTSTTFAADLALSRWTATDITASIESACCVPSVGYNELWLSVKRGTKRYIERMAQRLASYEPEDQFLVDCGITYDGAPASTITGLNHLEGKTVAILADGNVLAQQVVTSGQITLDAEYSKVHVGIPYNADLETLNIEVSMPDGTLQGRKVKVSGLTLRLINSRGGYIGPDKDTLHPIQYPNPATYGVASPLYNGDIKENSGAGYEDGGRLFIRQSDPLPIEITGIFPIVTPGGHTDE